MSNTQERIARCPFCGSNYVVLASPRVGFISVMCNQCDGEGPHKSTKVQAVTAWNTRPIEDALVKALEDAVSHCGSCGGSGTAYTMEDETEIGQTPGASGIDCPECSIWRAALKAAKGEE